MKEPIEITLFDSNFSHQEFMTPRIKSTKIKWVRDGVRRKLNVYTDNFIKSTSVRHDSIDIPNDGNISICMLLEPYTNPPWTDIYQYIRTDFEKFDLIVTHNLQHLGDLVENRPDKFVYSTKCGTTCWLDYNQIGLHKKKRNIFMIFSSKTYCEGHQIRHKIYEKYKDSGIIDFYGNDKYEPYPLDYKYAICCENALQPGMNSEKLNDCFLTGTIPIYWGYRNPYYPYKQDSIFYFSPDKIKIDFDFDESLEMLEKQLDYILKEDPYEKLKDSVEFNFGYSLEILQSENNLFRILKERFNDYMA